jgi:hypothetical protein
LTQTPTWPHTPKRQVLVPGKTALGTGPVSKSYLTWNLQRHRVSIERIRRDGCSTLESGGSDTGLSRRGSARRLAGRERHRLALGEQSVQAGRTAGR